MGEYEDWDKRNGLVECLKVEHEQGKRCNSPQPCLRMGAVTGCETLLTVGHSGLAQSPKKDVDWLLHLDDRWTDCGLARGAGAFARLLLLPPATQFVVVGPNESPKPLLSGFDSPSRELVF